MDINKIKCIGGFDELIVECTYTPMYRHEGLVVVSDDIKDSLAIDYDIGKQALGELIVRLVGEKPDEDTENKLYRKIKNVYKYYIAKCNIIILKGNAEYNREECMLDKTGIQSDIVTSFIAAQRLAVKIASKMEETQDNELSISIIDKVYVEDKFRKLGVSSWVHKNIADIIEIYTGYGISGVVLTCGDFRNEAKKIFNVTTEEYITMLKDHYKKLNYSELNKIYAMRDLVNVENMFFKVI